MSEKVELAGDRMTFAVDEQGAATITFDDKGTGRVCGECTLCCKLLPIKTLAKPPGQRCQHQQHRKGCTIYQTRPMECRTWACRWLADRETAKMPRPDRCHYVIDIQEDYITLDAGNGAPQRRVPALQIWVDPAFPDAHRRPELRAYMLAMCMKHGVAFVVRYPRHEQTIGIFPPPFDKAGMWHEVSGTMTPEHAPEWDSAEVGFEDGTTSRWDSGARPL